jgi:signal transduction histidine kinase
MSHAAFRELAARSRPVLWVVLLAAGALLLVLLAGREADRASRTAQVLTRDYASFVADRFVRQSADRYATAAGTRGLDANADHPSPLGFLRARGRERTRDGELGRPSHSWHWVRYLFVYDAAAGRLAISGPVAAEERGRLRQLLEGLDPRCGANQTLSYGRLAPISRAAPENGPDWSGTVETGPRGEVRSVYGVAVDELLLARHTLIPMIDPKNECQCVRNLLPEGLARMPKPEQAVAFVLRDASRVERFRSEGIPTSTERVTKPLSSELPLSGWTVEVATNPDAIRPLLPYGGREAPWALLLLLGSVVLGSAGLAIHSFRRTADLVRLRQDFVSNVSHELKTPLARIRLFNELLAGERQPDEAKRSRYRQVIDRECRRLTFLLDNVLDFSRLERGHRPALELVDLRRVSEDALCSFKAAAEEGRFSLEAALEDVPAVTGNAQALGQVVINLLDNAVKYSPAGARVKVRLFQEDGFVRLSVSDEGCGIPERDRERIFEEFYRVETGDAQRVSGSGLGLALVRRTVVAHGGDVGVVSAVGAGSTFDVRIPAARGTAGAAAREAARA